MNRYEAGETAASIAARDGVAVNAVYYHLHRRTVLRRDRGPVHGTPAGYQWHRRHGQKPCDPCRTARAESEAEYARRRRQRKGDDT